MMRRCEYHGNQGIKSESSWEWDYSDYTFGTLGAWENFLCVSSPLGEGNEGETQVPRLGEVPTSGAADHRQEQAN